MARDKIFIENVILIGDSFRNLLWWGDPPKGW